MFEALGARFFHTSSDIERNLDFQFAVLGRVMVELISPHDPKLPCAVTRMVEKQPCTLYHVCLKTHDLSSELVRLRKAGFKQVGKIIISDVYDYEATGVFLFSKGTGLIELVEEDKTGE